MIFFCEFRSNFSSNSTTKTRGEFSLSFERFSRWTFVDVSSWIFRTYRNVLIPNDDKSSFWIKIEFVRANKTKTTMKMKTAFIENLKKTNHRNSPIDFLLFCFFFLNDRTENYPNEENRRRFIFVCSDRLKHFEQIEEVETPVVQSVELEEVNERNRSFLLIFSNIWLKEKSLVFTNEKSILTNLKEEKKRLTTEFEIKVASRQSVVSIWICWFVFFLIEAKENFPRANLFSPSCSIEFDLKTKRFALDRSENQWKSTSIWFCFQKRTKLLGNPFGSVRSFASQLTIESMRWRTNQRRSENLFLQINDIYSLAENCSLIRWKKFHFVVKWIEDKNVFIEWRRSSAVYSLCKNINHLRSCLPFHVS